MPSPEARREHPTLRVWIDLSNSPHPLLFAPIARSLEERGHQVMVTARDNAQTVELARRHWPEVETIGEESPAGRMAKATALAQRTRALRRWAAKQRPDVALSHNSYAQIVAARLQRVPAVTAMDFEHQSANHLAFRLASLILLPEAVPFAVVRRQGARSRKVRRYPGLKEAVYLGEFVPDPGVLADLGIEKRADTPLVVFRPPPSRATYHRFESSLFMEALGTVARQSAVRCVVLARHPEQRRALRALALPNCTIPDRAIDARSLMYESDLMIGAGGTMTREAALMSIPTISVFAGRAPAVDLWLERRGLLRRVRDAGEIGRVPPRQRDPVAVGELRERGRKLREIFVQATLEVAGVEESSRRASGGSRPSVRAAATQDDGERSKQELDVGP